MLRPGGPLVVWSPNRFTLTTDPHLGLWGVGWLPRRWLPAYLTLRGAGRVAAPDLLGRRGGPAGPSLRVRPVEIGPPAVPAGWARSRPAQSGWLIRACSAARRLPGGRAALLAVGPLWELRAGGRHDDDRTDPPDPAPGLPRRAGSPTSGLSWVLAAEAFAGRARVRRAGAPARRLGPAVVRAGGVRRGGRRLAARAGPGRCGPVVYREAARRPRLVGPLTDLLIGLRCLAACLGYALVLVVAAPVGPGRGGAVAVAGLALFALGLGRRRRASGHEPARLGRARPGGAGGRLGFGGLRPGPRARRRPPRRGLPRLRRGARRGDPCPRHAADTASPRPSPETCEPGPRSSRGGRRAHAVRSGDASTGPTSWRWLVGRERPRPVRGGPTGRLRPGRTRARDPGHPRPRVARAWSLGPATARKQVADALSALWTLSLPASVGLALTSDRWMPTLFGGSYRDGGFYLALIAARLPWLLAASFAQSALVAFRREGLCLRLVLAQTLLAALLIPAGAVAAGPWGVGWASFAVEAFGAYRRLGPARPPGCRPRLAGAGGTRGRRLPRPDRRMPPLRRDAPADRLPRGCLRLLGRLARRRAGLGCEPQSPRGRVRRCRPPSFSPGWSSTNSGSTPPPPGWGPFANSS